MIKLQKSIGHLLQKMPELNSNDFIPHSKLDQALVLCQDKDLSIIRGYFESDQGASNEYSRGSMIEMQQ